MGTLLTLTGISFALIVLKLERRLHFISYGFVLQVKSTQAVKLCQRLGRIQNPRDLVKPDKCILSYCFAFSKMSQNYELAHKSSLTGNSYALTLTMSV